MRNLLPRLAPLLLAGGGAHACSLAMLSDVDAITPICCGGEEAADCSQGFPARCSPSCASLIVPFYDDCGATMAMMGPGFFTFDVHGALPLPSDAQLFVRGFCLSRIPSTVRHFSLCAIWHRHA